MSEVLKSAGMITWSGRSCFLSPFCGASGGLLIRPQTVSPQRVPLLLPVSSPSLKASLRQVGLTKPQSPWSAEPLWERTQVRGLQSGHLSSLCSENSHIFKPSHLWDHSLSQHLEGNPPPTPTAGSHALPVQPSLITSRPDLLLLLQGHYWAGVAGWGVAFLEWTVDVEARALSPLH